MPRSDRRSRTRWGSVGLALSGQLALVACSTPAALVESDVTLCQDITWEFIAAECPGMSDLECDALASNCEALEEFRR